MKLKTFKHNRIEECSLCNKVIRCEKDNWCSVLDFIGDKTERIKFYHRLCLTDLIIGKGRIIAQNFEDNLKKTWSNVIKKIKPMVNQMQNTDDKNKKEVVYEIKGAD